jgi:endoglucanase
LAVLQRHQVPASFFLTGRFYRNESFKDFIFETKQQGHYLGPHSDQHLLYCDWTNRDSLLISKQQFQHDLEANLKEIESFGINRSSINYFIPPYEWYNDSIAAWTGDMNLQLINFSPGTKSAADYTYPELSNYRSSAEIYKSIIEKDDTDVNGLNGFILLLHMGTDPRRVDKFYYLLDTLLTELKQKQYKIVSLNELLQ